MALVASPNQCRQLPLAVAYVRTFFLGVTGITLTVTISKAGAAFGAAAGAVAEISSGWYKISLTNADTDTLGDLAYHATDGGVNILDFSDQVAGYVTLANGVAHGGDAATLFLGSSTGFAAFSITNSSNGPAVLISSNEGNAVAISADDSTAVDISSGGANRAAIGLTASGSAAALEVYAGETGPAISLFGPYTTPGPAVLISTDSDNDNSSVGGDAVRIETTAGNCITTVPDGAGKADLNLTGVLPIAAAVPLTGNTTNSIMDCLNAARADGFGKWAIVGTTLTLYAADGTTAVRAFTLDSASAPTSRT